MGISCIAFSVMFCCVQCLLFAMYVQRYFIVGFYVGGCCVVLSEIQSRRDSDGEIEEVDVDIIPW